MRILELILIQLPEPLLLLIKPVLNLGLLLLKPPDHPQHLLLILPRNLLRIAQRPPQLLNLLIAHQPRRPFSLQQVLQLLDVGLLQEQLLLHGADFEAAGLFLLAQEGDFLGAQGVVVLQNAAFRLEGQQFLLEALDPVEQVADLHGFGVGLVLQELRFLGELAELDGEAVTCILSIHELTRDISDLYAMGILLLRQLSMIVIEQPIFLPELILQILTTHRDLLIRLKQPPNLFIPLHQLIFEPSIIPRQRPQLPLKLLDIDKQLRLLLIGPQFIHSQHLMCLFELFGVDYETFEVTSQMGVLLVEAVVIAGQLVVSCGELLQFIHHSQSHGAVLPILLFDLQSQPPYSLLQPVNMHLRLLLSLFELPPRPLNLPSSNRPDLLKPLFNQNLRLLPIPIHPSNLPHEILHFGPHHILTLHSIMLLKLHTMLQILNLRRLLMQTHPQQLQLVRVLLVAADQPVDPGLNLVQLRESYAQVVVLLAQEFHLVFDAVPVVVDGCQGLTVGGRDDSRGWAGGQQCGDVMPAPVLHLILQYIGNELKDINLQVQILQYFRYHSVLSNLNSKIPYIALCDANCPIHGIWIDNRLPPIIQSKSHKLGAMDNSDNDERDLQQNLQNNTEQGRRRRRTRSDDKDRNYKCSCGRSYLSYPALYTHIKTKHEGKAPGIIQMPRTEKGTKLKKYNFRQEDEQEVSDSDKHLQEMMGFLGGIGGHRLDYNISLVFENISTEDKLPLIEAISECEEKKPAYILTDNGIYNIPIDHAFARFLLKLSKKLDLKTVQQIAALLMVWRQYINTFYGKFDKATYSCYCKQANTSNVLEVVNDLILNVFNENYSRFEALLQHGKLFAPAQRRDFHLTKFIYLFSKWLFAQKYTNSKLQLNTEGSENVAPI